MKKIIVIISLLILSCLLIVLISTITWNVPTQEEAAAVFLQDNPNYIIVSAIAGEGNSDAVYYHFEYKKPNDDKIYKEVWLFTRQENENWKVVNREVEKE